MHGHTGRLSRGLCSTRSLPLASRSLAGRTARPRVETGKWSGTYRKGHEGTLLPHGPRGGASRRSAPTRRGHAARQGPGIGRSPSMGSHGRLPIPVADSATVPSVLWRAVETTGRLGAFRFDASLSREGNRAHQRPCLVGTCHSGRMVGFPLAAPSRNRLAASLPAPCGAPFPIGHAAGSRPYGSGANHMAWGRGGPAHVVRLRSRSRTESIYHSREIQLNPPCFE